MLVEFSVSNFRSIRDKQTFSMVTKKKEFAIKTDFSRTPYLLKKLSIMGPNASGKSNFIKAMAFARYFICNSHKKNIDEKIPYKPYLLNKKFTEQPSEFEFVFLLDDALYQYGFAASATEIIDEWLFVTPKGGNVQKWILRGKDSEKENWYISKHLKGRRKEWIYETRPNTLLLSILGTQKNIEIPKNIIRYFNQIGILYMTKMLPDSLTKIASHEEEDVKARVVSFLKAADLGITDIRLEKIELTEESIKDLKVPDAVKKDMIKNGLGKSIIDSYPIHLTEENEKIEFDFAKDESHGTKIIFSLAYPIIQTLELGHILIIDELDMSMHFKELHYIIELFADEKANPHGAQLIFTHHSVTALKKLQRDEIYFVDKLDGFASEIVPLTDYENRDDVPFDKRYMDGMYNALPHIRKGV